MEREPSELPCRFIPIIRRSICEISGGIQHNNPVWPLSGLGWFMVDFSLKPVDKCAQVSKIHSDVAVSFPNMVLNPTGKEWVAKTSHI